MLELFKLLPLCSSLFEYIDRIGEKF